MLTSLKSLNLVSWLLKAIPLHSTMKTKTGMYIAYGLSLVWFWLVGNSVSTVSCQILQSSGTVSCKNNYKKNWQYKNVNPFHLRYVFSFLFLSQYVSIAWVIYFPNSRHVMCPCTSPLQLFQVPIKLDSIACTS